MDTLHIRAVGDLRSPYLAADGVPVVGRYAGRDRHTHEPLPEGEVVIAHRDYLRAISRGDLAIVAPKPITPAKATTKGTDQ